MPSRMYASMYASMRRCSVYLPVYLCVCVSRYVCMYAGMHVIGTYTYLFGLACTHTHTHADAKQSGSSTDTLWFTVYAQYVTDHSTWKGSQSETPGVRIPMQNIPMPMPRVASAGVREFSAIWSRARASHKLSLQQITQNARTYRNIEAGTPSHLLHTLANTAIDDDRYVFKFSSCGNI